MVSKISDIILRLFDLEEIWVTFKAVLFVVLVSRNVGILVSLLANGHKIMGGKITSKLQIQRIGDNKIGKV